MPKRTGSQNAHLLMLIADLRKLSATSQTGLWRRLADDLCKASRKRREVNLSRLARETKPNETVVVPGKVLGAGRLNHGLTVAAWTFSQAARSSIADAKGKCITITDLIKQNPKPSEVRIIG